MADVQSCVAAVASAFQSGADVVQGIRERSEKKKKRKEKDLEQAFAEKMLQKALIEGGNKCQSALSERRQRFGPAFDIGDAIATSALKDIMISLQTEVISALQIARAVENAELDLNKLYEVTITNKSATVRILDDLCQRLANAYPPPPRQDYPRPMISEMEGRSYYPSLQRQASDEYSHSLYMSSRGSPQPHHMPSQDSLSEQNLARMRSVRFGADAASEYRNARAAMVRSPDLNSQTRRQHQEIIEEQDEAQPEDANVDPEELRKLSLHVRHDSAMGSDYGSRGRPSESIASTVFAEEDGKSCTSVNSYEQPPDYEAAPPNRPQATESNSECRSESSYASTPNMARRDSDADAARAESAPEVVTKEFESMLTQQPPRMGPHSYVPNPPDMKTIHPAYRQQYNTLPAMFEPEPERIWSPLQRPAKINNYHGFCKGAWSSRSSLQEGLSIAMISNFKGESVPHWKCKQCEFRSRGVNNTKVLPNQIYYASCGIRYRWVFLTKSHVTAEKGYQNPESYGYGCMFCAAQGHDTGVHSGLDALMSHIMSKHKTISLTPEVLEKTRCVVGGSPDRADDWDINIPASTGRRIGDKTHAGNNDDGEVDIYDTIIDPVSRFSIDPTLDEKPKRQKPCQWVIGHVKELVKKNDDGSTADSDEKRLVSLDGEPLSRPSTGTSLDSKDNLKRAKPKTKKINLNGAFSIGGFNALSNTTVMY